MASRSSTSSRSGLLSVWPRTTTSPPLASTNQATRSNPNLARRSLWATTRRSLAPARSRSSRATRPRRFQLSPPPTSGNRARSKATCRSRLPRCLGLDTRAQATVTGSLWPCRYASTSWRRWPPGMTWCSILPALAHRRSVSADTPSRRSASRLVTWGMAEPVPDPTCRHCTSMDYFVK